MSLSKQLNFSQRYKAWLFRSWGFEGYSQLFDILHSTEFVWKLPMDSNRGSDGRHLRVLYEDISNTSMDVEELEYPCSFLEMLIALAETMNSVVYQPGTGKDAKYWLWLMLDNIGLGDCDDIWFDETANPSSFVQNRIDDVMLRRYSPNGEGGIFPLYEPKQDQRDVELWYQLNNYVIENQLV